MTLGALKGDLGDTAGAEDDLRQALALQPDLAEAHYNLGNVLRMRGKLREAIASVERAVGINPDYAAAWTSLGRLYVSQKDAASAERCCQRAVSLRPDSMEPHLGLGNVYAQSGELEAAVGCYEKVVELAPGFSKGWYVLGYTLSQLQRHGDAESCARRAIALQPDLAEAHVLLGNSLRVQNRLDESIDAYRRAVAIRADDADAHFFLANTLMARGRAEEAASSYQAVIRLQPTFGLACNRLGNALQQQGKLPEAIAAFNQALSLSSADAAIYSNLGNAYRLAGDLEAAETNVREALRLKPDSPEAHSNLGEILRTQGLPEDAVHYYRRAIELQPDFSGAHSNLLLCLNYLPDHGPAALFAAHREWGQRHAPCIEPAPDYANVPDRNRRLRIGYVSPDLRNHAVACFIEPVLANHDPENSEIICYAEVSKPDAVTERLQAMVHGWCSTCGLTDEQVAKQIRSDGIDILVDLAGHTAGSRLTVFALRPAPVQVAYLGYANTTGLTCMDYRLTDEVADPPGDEGYYTEKLRYLRQGFSCYAPSPFAPSVSPLPARKAGYATFASFNNLVKINPAVIDLWCRVLHANPSSRMIVFRHILKGMIRERLQRAFTERGIDPKRLDLLSEFPAKYRTLPAGQWHLGLYDYVDVTLDTFPWNGHTISCESLWMGVPVVTLYGDRHAGRICASVLKAVGLERLIARDPGEYVRIATGLANDLDELERLRAGMRDRLRASALCDGAGFTRRLEQAYREMWGEWCDKFHR